MKKFNIEDLLKYTKKPEIYTQNETLFWDDPYISKQMLKAHLDPNTDRASYRPETINKIVMFLKEYLSSDKEKDILDTGCGPGLYCEKFSQLGLKVSGIDKSQNSINYAKDSAKDKGLDIQYINDNYLDMNFENEFDVISIISQDFCVLNEEERRKYLQNVCKALKVGGYFVLDVSTPNSGEYDIESSDWYGGENGFWSPQPYIALENKFSYKSENVGLYQCIIATDDSYKVYRIYHQNYTKETITDLLETFNFQIVDIFEDLTGTKYNELSKSLGVVARKN